VIDNNNTAINKDSDLITVFITPIGPQQSHELGELLPWVTDPNWQPPAEWNLDSEATK
jgi:hypothetical protein